MNQEYFFSKKRKLKWAVDWKSPVQPHVPPQQDKDAVAFPTKMSMKPSLSPGQQGGL